MLNLSHKTDTIINLILIVVGVVTLAIVFRGCVTNSEPVLLSVGQDGKNLFDIRDSGQSKNVVILLDLDDPEIVQNISFYKKLTQNNKESKFSLKAFFKNEANRVSSFLSDNDLVIENKTNVNPLKYQVQNLPTLILMDRNGIVEQVFDGILSSLKQSEVEEHLSIDVTKIDRLSPLPLVKPLKIYDETRPVSTIMLPEKILESGSGVKFQSPSYKHINELGVDNEGNIIIVYQEHILKLDKTGTIAFKTRVNSEFHGGLAVGATGKTYQFLKSRKVLILDRKLENERLLDLTGKLSENETCVKMLIDESENNLYFQTYNVVGRQQSLYKLDLSSNQIERLVLYDNTPYTLPNLGPGIFDWDINKDRIYISHYERYQIDVFSLKDFQHIGSIKEDHRPHPINPKDSEVKSLGLDLPHILKDFALTHYPAIWAIAVANDNTLYVFTSERDKESRQVIKMYNENYINMGYDYRYFRPLNNNFTFRDKTVYVVDSGGDQGRPSENELSPMDNQIVPAKITIFRSLL